MNKLDYKFMHVILNQCLRLNNGKAMFSVFLYLLIQFLGIGIVTAPLVSEGSIHSVLISLFLFLIMNVCSEVLLFGLHVIMSRLVEKKHVTIGFLFIGFRRNQRKTIKIGLVYTAIYVFVSVVLAVLYIICKENYAGSISSLDSSSMLPVAVVFVLLFSLLVTMPFSFVRLIVYNDNGIAVLKAFAKSARLMKGHFFNFIGFLLYAGGINLVQAIAIQLFLFILPQSEDMASSFQILVTFLSILGLMAQYKALTRFFMAIPVYYYSLIGVIHPHRTEDIDSAEEKPIAENSIDKEGFPKNEETE